MAGKYVVVGRTGGEEWRYCWGVADEEGGGYEDGSFDGGCKGKGSCVTCDV